jgi:hypothetical protein
MDDQSTDREGGSMNYTSGDLWGALYDIGNDEPFVPEIPQEIVARLIELKIVELKATGLPILTEYGRKCYSIMESGKDVIVPGLDDPAPAAEG